MCAPLQNANFSYHDIQNVLDTKLKVPWMMPNPSLPREEIEAQFPRYKNATPLRVTVERGEMLYLPAMWYHHVAQSDVTVAVNFWHDMTFDQKWVFFNMAKQLSLCNTDNSHAVR
jgi:jumonji domain-containing protein 7